MKPPTGPNNRTAIMINRIDASVNVDKLADLPFPDQPDIDIFATSYKERAKSYYSICVAVTKLGMMQRALDFVEKYGGVAHLDTFEHFRNTKRGRFMVLPRDEISDESNTPESPLDWLSDRRIVSNAPFDLAVKAFWADNEQEQVTTLVAETVIDNNQTATKDVSVAGTAPTSASVLSLEEQRSHNAQQLASRFNKLARQAIANVRELRTKRLASSAEDADDLVTDHEYESAVRSAYQKLLAADLAQDKAQLADEVVRYKKHFKHTDRFPPIVQHSTICSRDDTSKPSISPSELHDPRETYEFPSLGVLRWRLSRPLSTLEFPRLANYVETVMDAYDIDFELMVVDHGVDADKQAYIQIAFEDHSAYLQGQKMEFIWGDHPFELYYKAAPLPTSTTVLRLDDVLQNADDTSTFVQLFDKTLAKHVTLEHAWRLDELVRDGNQMVSRKGTSVVALVKYKEDPKRLWDDGRSRELPGLIRTSNRFVPILMADRTCFCSRCLQDPHEDHLEFHLTASCPRKAKCDKCGRVVHKRHVCKPRASTSRN
ncbi:hypothetical protein PSEUBRA_006230 [Kalmanozyma brasiliensis GHG001]|uniref:uncharacterized protein n=1 Tax=Kalmanozyma brasiliensis (strain GHG001) TaxID=1365824 RepID=UPI002867E382|nr:uncharacterized protein PSEUBRA_006230 [Kalmanozyma brasiliensis GHG001]KAF6767645.1 hypothetical protein PSEUBRA_006230 [Kalmanozyma brasiliensis GHG001]